MNILHVANEFQTRVSPMIIRHKLSGSTFYFYGANDPQKLKSNIDNTDFIVLFEKYMSLSL